MKKISFFTLTAFFLFGSAKAQLFISSGSTFFIQPTGVVTVQGDLTGNADIQGGGKVLLKGAASQNVNMNGFTIPNLELDNTSNATLTGNTRIGSSLLFTNGKILAGNFNLNLADVATVNGMGTSKFVETVGTGQVIKELSTNITSNEIPLGAGTLYRPAYLTTTGTTGGNVGVQVVAAADPNRPPSLNDYINVYWPVTKSGATGTVNMAGKYDVTDIAAGSTQANIAGYYYAAPNWSSAGESHTPASYLVSAPVSTAAGDLTGIDKFVLLSAKAYLQGAYAGSGLMTENLRTAGVAGVNVIPLTDPYRSSPYTASYSHTNNPKTETAAASVFTTQAPTTNDITDWVFLELRNNAASPGNAVLETRSALIRKDGMITDVDGLSPVTFNNIAPGNYTIAVRHRNHLGMSTNPATFTPALSETKSAVTLVDFSTATASQIYNVPANGASFVISGDAKNLLWGGNANFNTSVKYNGLGNDKDYILVTTLGNNSAGSVNNTYHTADVNLNGKVIYNGLGNDKDYIFNTVLGSNSANIRTQSIPN